MKERMGVRLNKKKEAMVIGEDDRVACMFVWVPATWAGTRLHVPPMVISGMK